MPAVAFDVTIARVHAKLYAGLRSQDVKILGLYLCRRILDLHGGTISVESEPGQGATFRFEIPSRPPG
jgi:light-regulated signal transduction histidine kinase (bacteriophytochrome)